MKNIYLFFVLSVMLIISACDESDIYSDNSIIQLKKADYKVNIDTVYTYRGDSLYNQWLKSYNLMLERHTRSLAPEDDAFFSKQYIVKSTETTLLYGKNYIFTGAILEGNSIVDQKYVPVFINNRNPILFQ